LLESENLVCSATAGTKTALDIIQVWFNYFAASFFKALGIMIEISFICNKGTLIAGLFSPNSVLPADEDSVIKYNQIITFSKQKTSIVLLSSRSVSAIDAQRLGLFLFTLFTLQSTFASTRNSFAWTPIIYEPIEKIEGMLIKGLFSHIIRSFTMVSEFPVTELKDSMFEIQASSNFR